MLAPTLLAQIQAAWDRGDEGLARRMEDEARSRIATPLAVYQEGLCTTLEMLGCMCSALDQPSEHRRKPRLTVVKSEDRST